MVTRDTAWLPGTPSWVDMSVDSVDKAAAFYGALFGWEGSPNEEFGGYVSFTKGGRAVAGVGPKQSPEEPTAWTTYLASDNAEQTAAKVRQAGGQVIMEPMEVGPFGTMIIAADPAGAVFGVWQSGTHTGFGLANEPGSVTWNENLSRDYEGNKKFYTEVFGHEYSDMDSEGFNYATLDLGGAPVGGIGGLPDGTPDSVPSHWLTYFSVADTDAAVAKVGELGGTTLKAPFDTEFGRIAIVTDDQGAMFAMIKGPQPDEA